MQKVNLQAKASIYGLVDPRNNEIRYIGCTSCALDKRFKEHLRCRDNTYKVKWIKKLKNMNLIPSIVLIEETNINEIYEKEKYWINFYQNNKLTNGTLGGDGILGYKFSDNQKKMISERTKLGMTPEVRKKLSKSKKGIPAHNRIKIKDNFNNVFNSLTEASKFYDLGSTTISLSIKENRATRKAKFEVIK